MKEVHSSALRWAILILHLANAASLFGAEILTRDGVFAQASPQATAAATVTAEATQSRCQLAIKDTQFTLNGKPTFLYGISYYAGLGASEEFLQKDLDDVRRYGFNWIRVWATWAAFTNDVSAVDTTGNPREPFLSKLRSLVSGCDRRGMVVDVTLSRGNGATGPARLQTPRAHERAVEAITTALKPYRNWYLDLSNERNIRDQRFTSFAELKSLRALARKIDPDRLVTASHAGDINRDELREYLQTVQVDFISPHRPRAVNSPAQTLAKSQEYLTWMKELGPLAPVHYQEPFRRGYAKWEPTVRDFITDARQAKLSGAVGVSTMALSKAGPTASHGARSTCGRNACLISLMAKNGRRWKN